MGPTREARKSKRPVADRTGQGTFTDRVDNARATNERQP